MCNGFFSQRRLRLLAALRKQNLIETTSIFFRNAEDELDQSEQRLLSTNGCGRTPERRGSFNFVA